MAPITATSAGVPRQIIDDPKLLDLLHNRLSILSDAIITSYSKSDENNNDDDNNGGVDKAGNEGGDGDNDGDVIMADYTEETDGGKTSKKSQLFLDNINALVLELEGIPKWKFQEQVSFRVLVCIWSSGVGVSSLWSCGAPFLSFCSFCIQPVCMLV